MMAFKDFLVNAKTAILEFKRKHNFLVNEVEKLDLSKAVIIDLGNDSSGSVSDEQLEKIKKFEAILKIKTLLYFPVQTLNNGNTYMFVNISHISEDNKYNMYYASITVSTKRYTSNYDEINMVRVPASVDPSTQKLTKIKIGTSFYKVGGSKEVLSQGNTGWGLDSDNAKCLTFSQIQNLSDYDIIIFTCANSFCFFGVSQNLIAHGVMSMPGLDTSVYEIVRTKFENGKITFGSEWTADMETFNFGWAIVGVKL